MNKRFENFGTALSREQMKKVTGGCAPGELCGGFGDGDACGTVNTYCGTGTNVTCCSGLVCANAGNGTGGGQGQDKMCQTP
ncbi:MAG TPA: hypothetical protein PKG56_03100 [Chitinophagaceae bacterium]|nr:hypothetical protein [Chitinophagaceae bacterium]HNL82354.1 hypothetical protein [Chitinophagaceae bacterium]HNM34679.1 hypothetical protein [Chitinophagaceae bacterium]HNN32116.1 hypothetical protein [Chitinophagaceae bacterium]